MPNEREQALLLWLFVLIACCLLKPSIRSSLGAVVRSAMAHKIVLSVMLMLLYIAGIVIGLHYFGLWTSSNATTTIFWTVSVALVALGRVNSVAEDEHYFVKAVLDQLRLIMLFDFLINFYVFSLPVELAMVPATAFFGGLWAVSESKPEYKQVKAFLNWILAVMGFILVVVATYQGIKHFDTFASFSTLKDFVVPPLMSLAFLPFLYLFGLFVSYENLFFRLRFFVEGDELVAFTKARTIMAFNFRLNLLNRWARHINRLHLQSEDDVRSEIKTFKISQRM